jgi:hypothetical protein
VDRQQISNAIYKLTQDGTPDPAVWLIARAREYLEVHKDDERTVEIRTWAGDEMYLIEQKAPKLSGWDAAIAKAKGTSGEDQTDSG